MAGAGPLYLQESFTPGDLPGDFPAEWREAARRLSSDGLCVLDLRDDATLARIDRVNERLAARFGGGAVHRIQDAWSAEAGVRGLATDPRILAFLSGVYGRSAFPFQTLNFETGSEQAVHSDITHFSSWPEGFMAGVWIALEDVAEDAGPLVYYPGSHRLPPMTPDRMGLQAATPSAYEAARAEAVSAAVRAHDLLLEPGLIKKGQAIVWSANLLHGGAPVEREGATRRSQVTHYYFDDCLHYTPMIASGTGPDRRSLRVPADIARGGVRWPKDRMPSLKTAAFALWRQVRPPIHYDRGGAVVRPLVRDKHRQP